MNEDPTESPAQAPGDPAPPSAPTPAGNQNLIVGLILGAAVLLVFLLIIQMTGGSSGEHSELSQLREELENRKKALTSNNSLYSPPGETPENLAARLSSDSARLASLATQLQTMLTTAQANLKTSEDTVRNLSNQLAAHGSTTTANVALKQQLTAALTRAATAESQLQALQTETPASPPAAQMESVLRERDTLRTRLKQLETSSGEMEPRAVAIELRQQLGDANQSLADLQSANEKLRQERDLLRTQLEQAPE